MLQVRRGRVVAEQRSHPAAAARGARPSDDHQHEADLQRRRDDGGEEHQPGDDLPTVPPELLGASEHGGRSLATDGRLRPSMGNELAIT